MPSVVTKLKVVGMGLELSFQILVPLPAQCIEHQKKSPNLLVSKLELNKIAILGMISTGLMENIKMQNFNNLFINILTSLLYVQIAAIQTQYITQRGAILQSCKSCGHDSPIDVTSKSTQRVAQVISNYLGGGKGGKKGKKGKKAVEDENEDDDVVEDEEEEEEEEEENQV